MRSLFIVTVVAVAAISGGIVWLMRGLDVARVEAELTGPGGFFEVVEEDVLGERMSVVKNRTRSLRELLVNSRNFGDA